MTPEPPKIIQLDEIEPVAGPGTLTWRPVRSTLSSTSWLADERRSLEVHPENGSLYYNLACPEAVEGRREPALDALRRAFELRPKLAQFAPGDEDLASLRDDPEFRSLMERSNAG